MVLRIQEVKCMTLVFEKENLTTKNSLEGITVFFLTSQRFTFFLITSQRFTLMLCESITRNRKVVAQRRRAWASAHIRIREQKEVEQVANANDTRLALEACTIMHGHHG